LGCIVKVNMKIGSEKSAIIENNKFALTRFEIVFNRIFAILLVLTTVPLLLNIFTIPTIIIFVSFSFFLFFSKKYRPFANIIFLFLALGVYFVSLPIGWGLYQNLKEIRLEGFDFYTMSALFSIAPLIYVTFAVRNVLGNILAYFKTSTNQRKIVYAVSFAIVLASLLVYPFFSSVKLREWAVSDGGTNSISLILTKQALKHGNNTSYSRDYSASFDSDSNKYIYRLYLEDPIAESIVLTDIKIDGEKINFTTDNRVTCLNCQKDAENPYGLIFPVGKDIEFIISSDIFVKDIKLTETGDKVAGFIFWE